jgi:hypothetical protein
MFRSVGVALKRSQQCPPRDCKVYRERFPETVFGADESGISFSTASWRMDITGD